MAHHRKILHVDMDAFFASVEILDKPEYRGRPVVVGGSPASRSVVCAASYEARKYGIRSAMPCSRAYKLCPDAFFVEPNFRRYKEVSQNVQKIFSQYTDVIEDLGLDEAWLDVTENKLGERSATVGAKKIKAHILRETGLTCSVGVSYNKFLAKIATEVNKPNGMFVLPPAKAQAFILNLELKKLPYVGKVTEKKLVSLGVHNCKELYACSAHFLTLHFGKFGNELYQRVRGIDERPVETSRDSKQLSVENTFDRDMNYGKALIAELHQLVDEQWERSQKRGTYGYTVVLKVKFHDFTSLTRSTSHVEAYHNKEDILRECLKKLELVCVEEYPNKPIRLLGVGVTNFEGQIREREDDDGQLELFDND